jgi:proteasome alpha subunit
MMQAGPERYQPFFYGPEGRLIQVEYAAEAVSRGSTTIGVRTDKFALIASHVKPPRELVDPYDKIFEVDDHAGATGSGYISDMLRLIDELRLESQQYKLTMGTSIDMFTLAKRLGQYIHEFTLYSVRLPASSIILAGADQKGVHLYQVDPSGTFSRGSAFVVGRNSDKALEALIKGYSKDLTLEQAKQLVMKSVELAINEKPLLQMGIVDSTNKTFLKEM